MDLNILKPSIAKTLEISLGTPALEAELSQKLMDFMAEAKHIKNAVKKAEELIEGMHEKLIILGVDKSLAEDLVLDLTIKGDLSNIVKSKNKDVLDRHNIRIDYKNKTLIYPKDSPTPSKSQVSPL